MEFEDIVTEIELIEHNFNILRKNSTGVDNIIPLQGNATQLEIFENKELN